MIGSGRAGTSRRSAYRELAFTPLAIPNGGGSISHSCTQGGAGAVGLGNQWRLTDQSTGADLVEGYQSGSATMVLSGDMGTIAQATVPLAGTTGRFGFQHSLSPPAPFGETLSFSLTINGVPIATSPASYTISEATCAFVPG